MCLGPAIEKYRVLKVVKESLWKLTTRMMSMRRVNFQGLGEDMAGLVGVNVLSGLPGHLLPRKSCYISSQMARHAVLLSLSTCLLAATVLIFIPLIEVFPSSSS